MTIATMCKIMKSAQRLLSASLFPSQRFTSLRYIGQLNMFQRRLIAEKIGGGFELSDDMLTDVARRMVNAMDKSQIIKNYETRIVFPSATDIRMKIMPYIKYLSLEMSDGENIRTRFTMISDTNVFNWSKVYPLSRYMKYTDGRLLFDRASFCLSDFTKYLGVSTDDTPLVFTFGFPVNQNALDSAVMYRSTKEYDCARLEGQDVVAELSQSLSRNHIQTGPMVILNDASAMLLESGANDVNTRVSLIVDNGCNCCYVDDRSNTICNTEWGAFGEDGILLYPAMTKYDISLNYRSRQPGRQTFEKMTSGMYMGELVRDMILEMANRKALFDGHVTSRMNEPYVLTGDHISAVESDGRRQYRSSRAVLENVFGVADATDFDCELFRYACSCVSRRSACLVAAGLSGVFRLLKTHAFGPEIPHLNVAVGGSVFRRHPKYASLVQSKTQTLMADNHVDFSLRITDSNGILVTKPTTKLVSPFGII